MCLVTARRNTKIRRVMKYKNLVSYSVSFVQFPQGFQRVITFGKVTYMLRVSIRSLSLFRLEDIGCTFALLKQSEVWFPLTSLHREFFHTPQVVTDVAVNSSFDSSSCLCNCGSDCALSSTVQACC